MIGVAFGFVFMCFPIAFDLGAAFQEIWALRKTVRWTGIVILLWLC